MKQYLIKFFGSYWIWLILFIIDRATTFFTLSRFGLNLELNALNILWFPYTFIFISIIIPIIMLKYYNSTYCGKQLKKYWFILTGCYLAVAINNILTLGILMR